MKRFLALFAVVMVLAFPVMLMAQTVAVQAEATIKDQVIQALVAGAMAFFTALATALTATAAAVGKTAWEWFRKKIAETKAGQKYGILLDALQISLAKKAKEKQKHYVEIVFELARIFRDGKVSEDEKARLRQMRAEILADAAQVAGGMISECRGLVVENVQERLDALLGELEYRLTGSPEALIPTCVGDSVAVGS